jgi:beta-lactamase class A
MKNKITIIILLSIWGNLCNAQSINELRNGLNQMLTPYRAEVGIAVKNIENGDTLTINNELHFPMQSVYKFPLAMAVLHQVDEGKMSLKQMIHIKEKELMKNTWSPLKRKHPKGDVNITLTDLLNYMVSKSDNNACDVLFKLMGGTKRVEQYFHSLGYTNIAIKTTEKQMQKGEHVQYTNWCLPNEMTNILSDFYLQKHLSKSSREFLMNLMIQSENGPKRIKELLPPETTVAHKTGTGIKVVNDVGIITLPSGNHIAISVFIQHAEEEFETIELLIAQISKAVYDHYTTQKPNTH